MKRSQSTRRDCNVESYRRFFNDSIASRNHSWSSSSCLSLFVGLKFDANDDDDDDLTSSKHSLGASLT